MRHVLLFIPFYRWENCTGLESLSNVAGDSSNKWQSQKANKPMSSDFSAIPPKDSPATWHHGWVWQQGSIYGALAMWCTEHSVDYEFIAISWPRHCFDPHFINKDPQACVTEWLTRKWQSWNSNASCLFQNPFLYHNYYIPEEALIVLSLSCLVGGHGVLGRALYLKLGFLCSHLGSSTWVCTLAQTFLGLSSSSIKWSQSCLV